MEVKQANASIPRGYKQTEVGLIPEDWDVRAFSSLGTFYKGKGIKKDAVIADGIPCVRYGELYTQYHNTIDSTVSFISTRTAKESFQLKYGDLLFAGSGETKTEIGKSATILVDGAFAGGDIVILRPKDSINPIFLGYISNSNSVTRQKSLQGQGDAVVHIYSSGIAQINIPLPTLHEQKAIATALSEVDELIGGLEKLIEKKRVGKQGAMQELLTGKTRLQGFQGSGQYKQTEVGRIPEEWGVTVLKSVLNTIADVDHYMPQTKKTGIPYVMTGDLKELVSNIDFGNCKKISVDDYGQLSKKIKNSKGDIILARYATVGSVSYVDVDSDFIVSYSCVTIKPNTSKLSGRFLFYYFKSSVFESEVYNKVNSNTQSNVGIGDLNEMKILSPNPRRAKVAIAEVLSDMDAEIEALEAKREKYRAIKQGMMQELLTGKTRLV